MSAASEPVKMAVDIETRERLRAGKGAAAASSAGSLAQVVTYRCGGISVDGLFVCHGC